MSATHLLSFVILFLLCLVAERLVWSGGLLLPVVERLLSPLVLVSPSAFVLNTIKTVIAYISFVFIYSLKNI